MSAAVGLPLAGRTAIVTGGGRGLGRGIALELGRAGADVAVAYHRHRDRADQVVVALEEMGRRSVAVVADITDRAAVEAMVDEVVAALGPPDILVNNAGIASRSQPVISADPDHFEKVVKVDTFGAFHCSAAVLPHMRTRPRGDIVVVSSVASTSHIPGGAPYNVAKAAVEELAFTLAVEEAPHGIHVNVVAPGLVVSDMGSRLVKAATGSADITALDPRFPFGHVCRPEEIGALVAALCGPAGSYVTGQRIAVDGGGIPPGAFS